MQRSIRAAALLDYFASLATLYNTKSWLKQIIYDIIFLISLCPALNYVKCNNKIISKSPELFHGHALQQQHHGSDNKRRRRPYTTRLHIVIIYILSTKLYIMYSWGWLVLLLLFTLKYHRQGLVVEFVIFIPFYPTNIQHPDIERRWYTNKMWCE